ncbi:FKBP-type peptidyl-prolyl cis-trans isomerase [Niabella sp. CC-SYL272]|uniref:FKBP-type peptidyl-prolyl cis-trans isomerase n=1 Tax=Niabella agricola TaxID=2891571 RepID=UPI001F3EF101|nr:FKBP-type peptidyl-prolyl cis-trans isomerase [Niabella agricola]MCF3108392.1 FKBP-type peptidyl-prolyl cis-trans isomerase [Niabella agricola]
MKQLQKIGLFLFAVLVFTACKNTEFKTTSSGLKYKIFGSGGKDSLAETAVLKMNMTVKVKGHKDTVLADTYGKLPFFTGARPYQPNQPIYDPAEVFKYLKKGDSMVAIVYIDSAIRKGMLPEAQMPPYFKKGDQIIYTYKVLDVFSSDSLARNDYKAEIEKLQKNEELALEKSGEKAKQTTEVENYLKSKNINAVKTPLGAFVKIDNPGTGAPVADKKFVSVKYTGKKVLNDSTFEGPNSFTTQIGVNGAIRGFEDGLRQFKQGGKGVIYIPGFLAYGKTPPPGSPFKEFEPLYFEVEITEVSDSMPAPQMPPAAAQKIASPGKEKKK